MKKYDRTYVEINLPAIKHNLLEAKRNIKPGTKLMAIVKANAYGHGAIKVSHYIKDVVDAYGVAIMEEALELRKSGIEHMILILGYTGEEWFEELIQNDISQTVYNYEMAEKLNEVAMKLEKKAKIHIKLDTGMSRIGFPVTKETLAIVKQISKLPGIEMEGIFTHFAKADEETAEQAKEPFHKFMTFIHQLENEGVMIPIKHVSNSASIIGFPEANLDMVRSGISTYGLYPSEKVAKDVLLLHPAMEWKTHISFIKEVKAGTDIGYGGTFTAKYPMKVATIPVGYADGMKRDLSNKGYVLVRGIQANILGRICMDQFMIDVTNIPEVKCGDVVTIFGTDGDAGISVEEIAELSHSFNYEFICNISPRVPRKYKKNLGVDSQYFGYK